MDRVLRISESFEEAEEVDLDDWLALSGEQRLEIGERMREECWPNRERGFSRVLRVAPPPRR
jgi:hypothetical protein